MNNKTNSVKHKVIVIGASSGGMEALKTVLSILPQNLQAPILIVQHVSHQSDNFMVKYLSNLCNLTIKEADEKEKIKKGCVYIAPPNYHLLVEKDETLSLTVDQKVNYARPSIDVLFESAADAFGPNLIGIILTGANSDGSKGLKYIKERGGIAIVQNPTTAEIDAMPKAAIQAVEVDYILNLDEISYKLLELIEEKNELHRQSKHTDC